MNHPFGWSLPPGVRSCDIPGNRPEDVEAERFDEDLFGILIRAQHNGLTLDELVQRIGTDWPEAIQAYNEEQDKIAKAEEEMYRQMAEDDAKAEEMYRRGEELADDDRPPSLPPDNDDPDRHLTEQEQMGDA